jgi:hypothetical protein
LISKFTLYDDEDPEDVARTDINVKLLKEVGQIVEEYEGADSDWLSLLYSEARAKARKRDDVFRRYLERNRNVMITA